MVTILNFACYIVWDMIINEWAWVCPNKTFFTKLAAQQIWLLGAAAAAAAAAAKSLQSCPTRCDPIDGSPPSSPVPGILQARTLEWVAMSFSNAWKWKVKVKSLSPVRLFITPILEKGYYISYFSSSLLFSLNPCNWNNRIIKGKI